MIFCKVINTVVFVESSPQYFHAFTKVLSRESENRVKFLNFWNGSKFALGNKLFPEKLDNFKGKILR